VNVRLNKVVYGRAMGNTWPAEVAAPVMSSALDAASVLDRLRKLGPSGMGAIDEVIEKETVPAWSGELLMRVSDGEMTSSCSSVHHNSITIRRLLELVAAAHPHELLIRWFVLGGDAEHDTCGSNRTRADGGGGKIHPSVKIEGV